MSEIKPGFDRVTDVIGVFSGLDKIDPAILKNAGDRGTTVHAIIDKLIESPSFFCAPMIEEMVNKYARNPDHGEKEMALIQNMLQSFERWADGKKFEPKPERFYDEEWMVTGEADQIYKCMGNNILVDFKTPENESKTWLLQGSAYYAMAQEKYQIRQVIFVKLCRKGGIAKEFYYEPNIDLFESCLDTYRYFYKDKKFDQEIDYI
jgi:ATP-dependent exoDNAse (exonuclease V) beta subunit